MTVPPLPTDDYTWEQFVDLMIRPTPVTLTASSGVITPDASAAIEFRHVATANVTLAEPINGIDGQVVSVAVQASGAARTLTVTGAGSVSIPSGQWWLGRLRRDAATSTWLLEDSAGQTTITTGTGGGGSATPVAAVARLTSGDLSLGNTSWTAVDASLDLTLAASVGDWVEVSLNARVASEANNELWFDAATMVSGAGVNWLSTATTVAASHYGEASWSMPSGYRGSIGGSVLYQVQSGDISGGTVTLRLFYSTGAASPTRTVNALPSASGYPLAFSAKIIH